VTTNRTGTGSNGRAGSDGALVPLGGSTGSQPAGSQSARRTLRLLAHLAEAGPSSLSSVALALGINKSTAHRFLSALVEEGWVKQVSATRDYVLTPKILQVGALVLDRMEVRSEVRPYLELLSRTTSETVHLGVLDGFEVAYVDKVEGDGAVKMASRIGGRGTCHSTGMGKVLLASRPEREWARYVDEVGLVHRTARTFTEPQAFYDELRRIRRDGYAVDDVENEEGIRCLAAPIRDRDGAVVAAMSVSGWTLSMTPERIPELVPVVLRRAEEASRALGYEPNVGLSDPSPKGPIRVAAQP